MRCSLPGRPTPGIPSQKLFHKTFAIAIVPGGVQGFDMSRVSIALPERFVFATELRVRISDVNYGNHLGNDAVLSLLQEARMRFLAQFGFTEIEAGGAGMVMVDAAVIYKAQSAYGDPLRIELSTEHWSFAAFDFVYRVTHAVTGREVARAKTGMCFINYATGKVAGAPAAVREQFGGGRDPV
jgi:acyl-CoA thioesterase FadM